MKHLIARCAFGVWLRSTATFWLLSMQAMVAAQEETFDLLKTRTRSYTNVTVTSKAKTYIFIMHAAGMGNIKVADLPPDVLEKLGYAPTEKPKPATDKAAAWAKQTLAKADLPQIQGIRRQVAQNWMSYTGGEMKLPVLTRDVIFGACAAVLLLYLFYCHCCKLICVKTGLKPGVAIWLPIIQLFPLLRAAQMSGGWFLAYLVPGLNVLAQIVWSIKIVRARRKSAWVAFWLLLPVTSLFAFLYLAFSGSPAPKKERRVELMTLETA